MQFVEEIEPKFKTLMFELQKKYLATPQHAELAKGDRRFAILDRQWQADVDVFREENVPLETEVTKLVTDYDKVMRRDDGQFPGQRLHDAADRALQRRAGSRHATGSVGSIDEAPACRSGKD